MTTTESLYRDSLLRWLRNRRECPDDNTPEPDRPPDIALPPAILGRTNVDWLGQQYWAAIRAEVLRDFERKEP